MAAWSRRRSSPGRSCRPPSRSSGKAGESPQSKSSRIQRYTWPANPNLGPLLGYTHDRESGEYTGYHLREFIRLLAQTPNLERLHIIAHSRGTDVAITTLRELQLEFRGTGIDIRDRLKI